MSAYKILTGCVECPRGLVYHGQDKCESVVGFVTDEIRGEGISVSGGAEGTLEVEFTVSGGTEGTLEIEVTPEDTGGTGSGGLKRQCSGTVSAQAIRGVEEGTEAALCCNRCSGGLLPERIPEATAGAQECSQATTGAQECSQPAGGAQSCSPASTPQQMQEAEIEQKEQTPFSIQEEASFQQQQQQQLLLQQHGSCILSAGTSAEPEEVPSSAETSPKPAAVLSIAAGQAPTAVSCSQGARDAEGWKVQASHPTGIGANDGSALGPSGNPSPYISENADANIDVCSRELTQYFFIGGPPSGRKKLPRRRGRKKGSSTTRAASRKEEAALAIDSGAQACSLLETAAAGPSYAEVVGALPRPPEVCSGAQMCSLYLGEPSEGSHGDDAIEAGSLPRPPEIQRLEAELDRARKAAIVADEVAARAVIAAHAAHVARMAHRV
jgi:hypothetical protein